ncbi:hypothetical protein R1sor_001223 [Riccia sorocarpa]|uniref:MIR domain-containing protein n=1 Tax=Riccia sorocarpa TaxID=122646 RepID=A0ABD3GZI5_9MARC
MAAAFRARVFLQLEPKFEAKNPRSAATIVWYEFRADLISPSGPGKAGSGGGATSSQSLTHRSRLVTGNSGRNKERVDREQESAKARDEQLRRARGNKVLKQQSQFNGKEISIWTVSCLGFSAGMGLLVFGALVLLGFLSPFESSGPQSVGASTGEGREVTYGSLIKLQHDRTKYRLHSHEVPYGTGSGQQSVTGFPGGEDANSYWIVKPIAGAKVKQGEVVTDGSVIRFFHPRTRKWLHSHLHASPITGNYEVSAFGSDEQSDTGDHWKLIIEGKAKVWLRDQKVRFLHVDTGGYLHSHDKKYSRIVSGQQEVCGIPKKNSDNLWFAAEGVYFPSGKDSKESI